MWRRKSLFARGAGVFEIVKTNLWVGIAEVLTNKYTFSM